MKAAKTHPNVDIIEAHTLHKGHLRLDRYRLRHRRYDGQWSQPYEREVVSRRPAVCVLLLDPRLDRVVLIEQFRLPALLAGEAPWQLEVVAGLIDEGETKEAAAIRECREETGLEPQNLTHLTTYLSSAGMMTEEMTVFLAQVDSTKAQGFHGQVHEEEDIRLVTLPRKEAIARALKGQIRNAAALIALLWLAKDQPGG